MWLFSGLELTFGAKDLDGLEFFEKGCFFLKELQFPLKSVFFNRFVCYRMLPVV